MHVLSSERSELYACISPISSASRSCHAASGHVTDGPVLGSWRVTPENRLQQCLCAWPRRIEQASGCPPATTRGRSCRHPALPAAKLHVMQHPHVLPAYSLATCSSMHATSRWRSITCIVRMAHGPRQHGPWSKTAPCIEQPPCMPPYIQDAVSKGIRTLHEHSHQRKT